MPILLAILMTFLVASVSNAENLRFRSPSGNIECMMNDQLGGYAFCGLSVDRQSYTDRPEDCDADWGNFFEVGREGEGTLACVSDYFYGPPEFTLPYGARITFSGMTCLSEQTGMTCTNASGGGFSINRRRQSVF